jgi:phosphoribosylformylglycinamidine cyclo-ligase
MHQLSKKILDKYADIHGMVVHCSGWTQTKILHGNLHIIKRIYFQYSFIPAHSGAIKHDWNEMYQVFNCGHRMGCMFPAIGILYHFKSFNVDAQIVGTE